MDKVYLRTQFLKHKNALEKLYLGREGRGALLNCSDEALNTIMQIFYLINSGEIAISKQTHENLKHAKRLKKFELFASRQNLKTFLKSDRGRKIALLSQFLKLYPSLFHSLFNKIPS